MQVAKLFFEYTAEPSGRCHRYLGLRMTVSEPFGRLEEERMKAVDRVLLLLIGLI